MYYVWQIVIRPTAAAWRDHALVYAVTGTGQIGTTRLVNFIDRTDCLVKNMKQFNCMQFYHFYIMYFTKCTSNICWNSHKRKVRQLWRSHSEELYLYNFVSWAVGREDFLEDDEEFLGTYSWMLKKSCSENIISRITYIYIFWNKRKELVVLSF